jgi:carbon starvation protein CstA
MLGPVGGIIATIGVIILPITSGDTALRSLRLIIADTFHIKQNKIIKRILLALPVFGLVFLVLIWAKADPNGFRTIWRYFGWSNQTLATFALWTITVYLVQRKKPFIITFVPALFMTVVCSTFLLVSGQAFGLSTQIGYTGGAVILVLTLVWFFSWYRRQMKK